MSQPAELVPLSIFDQYGKARDLSADAALIESMGAPQRSLLMKTLSACAEAEKCEARIAELRTALTHKMIEHDQCVVAVDKNARPMRHDEALRATIDANAGRPVAKPRPVSPKPAAALKNVADELTAMRLEFQNESAALRDLSLRRGQAIGDWARDGQPVHTDFSVRRTYINNAAEHRLGLANGSIEPPPEPAPRHVWPIELARAAKPKAARAYMGSVKAAKR